MASHDPRTLRTRLREDLAAAHARLDGLLGTAELTQADGLRRFLATQLHGFDALALRQTPDDLPETAVLITEARAALRGDLAALDTPVPAVASLRPVAEAHPLSALAIDYIVLGSGLGTKVLRRSWELATDPAVTGAGAYFTLQRPPDPWRRLTAHLGDLPADGRTADRVVADAADIFALFEAGWIASALLSPSPAAQPHRRAV